MGGWGTKNPTIFQQLSVRWFGFAGAIWVVAIGTEAHLQAYMLTQELCSEIWDALHAGGQRFEPVTAHQVQAEWRVRTLLLGRIRGFLFGQQAQEKRLGPPATEARNDVQHTAHGRHYSRGKRK